MTTAIEAPAGPVIFSATAHGQRTEIRDLDAFRAENPDAEEIFAELLTGGSAEAGETHYELIDAQLLIQLLG